MVGGTRVTVYGEGFDAYPGIEASNVRLGWGDAHTRGHGDNPFATNLTTPTRLTDGALVVESFPAAGPTAAAQLYLAMNEYDLLPTNVSFLYYEQPTNFTAIEPTGGPTGGGTLVTITGGPFDRYSSVASDVLCRFGENYTRVTRLQSGRIECASPARTSDGLVDVHVSLNGIDTDFGASGYSFKYYDQPAPHPGSGFAQIVPNGGPVGGGTYVTIDGVGFLAFAPEISFVRCRWDGGVVDPVAMRRAKLPLDLPPPESSAATHTDERVVCLAPRARPGAGLTVNVSLSLNARDFGSTGLTFQYYQPPRIDIITPSGGHRTGGTIVTIHGAGFNVLDDGAHVSCEFGRGEVYNAKFTVVRPVERVTHSTIVCEAPTTKVSDTRGLWIALNGYEIDGARPDADEPELHVLQPADRRLGAAAGGRLLRWHRGHAARPGLLRPRGQSGARVVPLRGDVARRRARGAGHVSDRAALQLLDVPIAVAVEHPRGRGGVRADHIEHAAVRRHRVQVLVLRPPRRRRPSTTARPAASPRAARSSRSAASASTSARWRTAASASRRLRSRA